MNDYQITGQKTSRTITGTMARELGFWIIVTLGVLCGLLLLGSSLDWLGWDWLLLTPVAMVVALFLITKYALPPILKKNNCVVISGGNETSLSNWVALKLAYGLMWRIIAMTFFIQGVAPWFYLLIFGAPTPYMAFLHYVGIFIAYAFCCYTAVLWFLRSPHGKLIIVPAGDQR